VMRTSVSVLGLPPARGGETAGRGRALHRPPASSPASVARCSTGTTTATTAAASNARLTTTPSAAISCICAWADSAGDLGCAPCTPPLILYAEHEFNASTFTARVVAGTGSDMYSAITGAIGALRGPKHGGANEAAFGSRAATTRRRSGGRHPPAGAGEEGSHHRLRPSVYTISDPRNVVIKAVAKRLADHAGNRQLYDVADRER